MLIYDDFTNILINHIINCNINIPEDKKNTKFNNYLRAIKLTGVNKRLRTAPIKK
jgi:hypothetical protein